MKRVLSVLSSLIISALLISSVFTAFAAQDEWTEIQPSEAYTDYLNNPDKYDIPPQYYDSEAVDNQPGIPGVPKASNIELPEKFDVRDSGITPLIKDQGTDSTCSIFAVLGNFEIFAAKNNDIRFFSEYHAKHALAQNFVNGANLFGFNRTPAEGLHLCWASPYFINGRGPVPSSFSGYITGNDLVTSNFINSVKPEIQTQEIQVLPGLGSSATAEQTAQWLIELKELVYKYGSVAITMTANSSHSDTSRTYYYCSSMPSYHDHAVVCIGWDDTIPKEKFTNRFGETPSIDGGLIFKNSWGTTVGDSGYGYISYASEGISMQDFQLVTSYREKTEDEQLETYSELGAQSVIGNTSTSCKWYGNKFYLDKNERVTLKEISFYAPISDIKYDVYISPTGSVNRDDFTYITSITPDLPGYYSITTDLELGGEDFSEYFVAIKSNCGSAEYAIPIEGSLNNYENLCNRYMTYFEGDKRIILAYTTDNISYVTDNNIEWTVLETGFVATDNNDFSLYTFSNIPINAITEPFKITLSAAAEISALEAVQGDEISVTTTVESNVSGNYSYLYKLFFNDSCIDEFSGENYSFVPTQIGEYYVEVTVTDTVNNVTATAVTDTITVGKGALAIESSCRDNEDGTFTIQGGTVYPADEITYFIYVLKDGVVLEKSLYQPSVSLTFKADSDGVYTVKVYAQDADKNRVSKTESISK